MVCPVRESVGQVVGVVLDQSEASIRSRDQDSTNERSCSMTMRVTEIVSCLMSETGDWHTRHAAMIIIKYLLSVTNNTDQLPVLITKLFPVIVQGLQVSDQS